MRNERDAGFSLKRGGNAGSGPPLPDPVVREMGPYKDREKLWWGSNPRPTEMIIVAPPTKQQGQNGSDTEFFI